MRYPASEKLEIIRLVEQSHLPVRRTLEQLGVSRPTFYRWYDLYQTGGPEALEDRSPRRQRVWNRIPDEMRGQLVQLALEEPELSPRELATRFTDTESYFVSEASVYRLLKDHDQRDELFGTHNGRTPLQTVIDGIRFTAVRPRLPELACQLCRRDRSATNVCRCPRI